MFGRLNDWGILRSRQDRHRVITIFAEAVVVKCPVPIMIAFKCQFVSFLSLDIPESRKGLVCRFILEQPDRAAQHDQSLTSK